MSRFRILTVLAVVLSIATAISPVRADVFTAQNNRTNISANGAGNLIKELNLSQDQIRRLQQIRANSRDKNKERRQALRAARQELTQLLESNASSDQIRQKRQQVQSLQREVADRNFENTLAIREMLTPEQRLKWQRLIQQRRQNK
jgi:periplasmic protein CpxP/Spy